MTVLQADYTLVDGTLVPNLAIAISPAGTIADVGGPERFPDRTRLPGMVLLPGLVNAHSHAFQRALRGRAENRSPQRDSFWTWREAMYRLAAHVTPPDMLALARMAYMEMTLSGVTSVGEFHYLHHDPDGSAYADPDEMALQVSQAALDVGLNLVLLRVAYHRGGHKKSLVPVQKRFFDTHPEACIEAVERLRGRGLRVGIAPHSVRAVPREWLAPLHRYTQEFGLPYHMHVAEQPAEVAECMAEHNLRPVQLLAQEGVLDERFTAVHAVHLEPDEVALLGTAQTTVCACPTTERNLGDGIVPADQLLAAGVALALGSDSHAQIDLLEDARELEYHLRLKQQGRVVLSSGTDLASRLWRCATRGGARSLGLAVGEIAPGRQADLMAVSLDDPSLVAHDSDELLTNIVFSMARSAVQYVWIRGRLVVTAGQHALQEPIITAYREALQRIWTE